MLPTFSKGRRKTLITFDDGKTIESEPALADKLASGQTVRIFIMLRQPFNISSINLSLQPHGALLLDLGKPSMRKGIRVLEINNQSLRALADMGVGSIYEDSPMSASLADTIPLIGADRVQAELNYTGQGLAVCLLDTGVDFSLPSLGGKAITGYDFVNGDDNASDDNGHGTLMASVIHAVAPNATIFAVKVLDSTGTGYSSDIISGMRLLQAAGSRRADKNNIGKLRRRKL